MGDIFSNMSQRPSVPPPPTGMVVGDPVPKPRLPLLGSLLGLLVLGVSSETQMPRRMEEDVEGLGAWGRWGIRQPVVSVCPWVTVKETREGGGSTLVSTQALGAFCKTAGECSSRSGLSEVFWVLSLLTC